MDLYWLPIWGFKFMNNFFSRPLSRIKKQMGKAHLRLFFHFSSFQLWWENAIKFYTKHIYVVKNQLLVSEKENICKTSVDTFLVLMCTILWPNPYIRKLVCIWVIKEGWLLTFSPFMCTKCWRTRIIPL